MGRFFSQKIFFKNRFRGKMHFGTAWLIAVVAIVATGLFYRFAAAKLKIISETSIELSVPLRHFPPILKNWRGTDVPIPRNIQRIAQNDDSLNRVYTNQADQQQVNLYIAYTARPRTMLGHRPQVCYTGGGWIHDQTESIQCQTNAGEIPCLLHEFHLPEDRTTRLFVLNFYIVNGQITDDQSVFSGLSWRTPNIAGNPARYVAQIQISSITRQAILAAVEDMTQTILDFFPDRENRIQAEKYIIVADPCHVNN